MSETESISRSSGQHHDLAAIFTPSTQDHWMGHQDQCKFVERLATLTDMQMVVLSLISQGKFNKQIAFSCSITEATVKAHVSELLKRLRVQSRTEAAVKFTIISERMRLNRVTAAFRPIKSNLPCTHD